VSWRERRRCRQPPRVRLAARDTKVSIARKFRQFVVKAVADAQRARTENLYFSCGSRTTAKDFLNCAAPAVRVSRNGVRMWEEVIEAMNYERRLTPAGTDIVFRLLSSDFRLLPSVFVNPSGPLRAFVARI
jgi:hypothetical protein